MGPHILIGGVATQRIVLLCLGAVTLAVAVVAWLILTLVRRGTSR